MAYKIDQNVSVDTAFGTKLGRVVGTRDGFTTIWIENFIAGMGSNVFVKGNKKSTQDGWKITLA